MSTTRKTDSNKYWSERDAVKRQRLIDKKMVELNSALRRGYEQVGRRLLKEIKALYKSCTSVNDLYLQDRYYKLITNIDKELTALGTQQQDLIGASLDKTYYEAAAMVNDHFPHIPKPTQEEIQDALAQVWCNDGKNWSDRIWDNKDKLKEALSKTVVDALTTGNISYATVMEDMYGESLEKYNADMIKARGNKLLQEQIKKKFDIAYRNSKRLVVTELTHISEEATIKQYKEEGVKAVVAVGFDDRTCDECKRILADDNGDPIPFDVFDCPTLPLHPNCRDCWVAVDDEDVVPVKYSLTHHE